MIMAEHLQKAEFDKLKIRAAFFGVNLDEEKSKTEKKEGGKRRMQREVTNFAFKDPSEYERMSEIEKKELTEKMMGQHKKWSEGKLKG